MSKRVKDPTYRLHKSSGQAIVTLPDGQGGRKDYLLGVYDSEQSWVEYDRLLALWRANKKKALPAGGPGASSDLTIAELILKYMTEHAPTYYVSAVTKEQTSEVEILKLAFRPLNRLFGPALVREFGPLKLMTVREAMIAGSWMNETERAAHVKAGRPIGLARNTINRHVERIRRLFGWATQMELLSPNVVAALREVPGLAAGRSAARECPDIAPVAPEIVEATLPHLPPIVRDMVELQRLSGMRAGEVVSLRACDLDMSDSSSWRYKLASHKTQWMGHTRIVRLGPNAQAIVRKYLKPKLEAFLFSPADQDAIIKASLRARRQSKVQPSQVDRRKQKAQRKPGQCFTVRGYNRAIGRACKRAGLPHWHTHQLRHSAALRIENEFGLEAARACLGQKSVRMAAHYAGIDDKKAKDVMSKIG